MTKRRTYNWPQLLNDFSQSNLSQAEFCKQREINPTYFSLKLSKRKALETGAFAKVVVQPTQPSTQGLVLEIGNCKIHCPATMPIPSFVSLVKSLACLMQNDINLTPLIRSSQKTVEQCMKHRQ